MAGDNRAPYWIHNPSLWPPGSFIFYRSPEHRGIGLVVGNDGAEIAVVWDALSEHPFRTYRISNLNPEVIFDR